MVGDQTRQFIYDSSNTNDTNPYAVFRCGQSDDKYKTELSPEIIESIYHDLEGTELEPFLDG